MGAVSHFLQFTTTYTFTPTTTLYLHPHHYPLTPFPPPRTSPDIFARIFPPPWPTLFFSATPTRLASRQDRRLPASPLPPSAAIKNAEAYFSVDRYFRVCGKTCTYLPLSRCTRMAHVFAIKRGEMPLRGGKGG